MYRKIALIWVSINSGERIDLHMSVKNVNVSTTIQHLGNRVSHVCNPLYPFSLVHAMHTYLESENIVTWELRPTIRLTESFSGVSTKVNALSVLIKRTEIR